jgi:hypothetical protein
MNPGDSGQKVQIRQITLKNKKKSCNGKTRKCITIWRNLAPKKKKKTDLHLHFFVTRMRKFAPLKITTTILKNKLKNRKSGIGSLLL